MCFHAMRVGLVVNSARESSRLAVRRLAHDAGVAGSTITRIQSGVVDPSVGTLERILNATGFELRWSIVRSGTARHPRLEDLTDAWSVDRDELQLDWTRFRTTLDQLTLHPEWIPEAIYFPPAPSGHLIVDALLAGMAEKLADDEALPHPSWTELAPTLDEPFQPRVARHISNRSIPPQLEARGLMIDTESLWRKERDDFLADHVRGVI
jgi:transcriptional regulator with XRE-family HTH domain